MNFLTILSIGIGGFLGAVVRAYLSIGVNTAIPHHHLSFGTLAANVIGSFIIGVLFGLFGIISVSPHLKSFIITGFLGALTTFSTFAIESFFLIDAGNIKYFLINIGLNIFFTIFFVFIGYYGLIYILKLFGVNY